MPRSSASQHSSARRSQKEMIKHYLKTLLKFHNSEQSEIRKFVSLGIGAIVFLVLLPLVFFVIGVLVDSSLAFDVNAWVKFPIAVLGIIIGLYFLIWSTLTQLKIGHGTPAPNAPTKKLIISGPYRYTRNPIEFGALFYYFGLGTIINNISYGVLFMILGFVIGSSYHKFIEEKELLLRFGQDYEDYKKTTPFLIPKYKKQPTANKTLVRNSE